MAEKKIIKASEYNKKNGTKKTTSTKSKSLIDLGKIKDIIDDNPEAVKKIKEGVTDIITSKVIGNATKKTTKKTTKKSTKSENSDSLSKVMDLAGTLFKK